MKIAVLSDTHIPLAAAELPEQVFEILKTADAIIHAGDYQIESLIKLLESYAAFYGVCGNMDTASISQRLPSKRIITLGQFTIGVTHGWGNPSGLEDRVLASFKNDRIDAVVYGHSHRPKNELRDGILLFNPGSPTDSRFAPFHSMGMLQLDEKISGEIIVL